MCGPETSAVLLGERRTVLEDHFCCWGGSSLFLSTSSSCLSVSASPYNLSLTVCERHNQRISVSPNMCELFRQLPTLRPER